MTRPALKNAVISVVLPVFNETDVLDQLHRRVRNSVEMCGTGLEIIFVNDGSTDATPEILDSLAQKNRHVRVIHLARNFGHQAAIHAGLSHARGDAVVLMDADLQDSPEAIGRLVAEWAAGYDVVYALRADRPEALWKRVLFAGFHQLLNRVASTAIPADAGNFSIIDARVVREILDLGECDRYLPGLRSWVGFKQRGVEIRREARYDGRPRVALRGLWHLAKTAIFSFSSLPLTLFYVIGYGALALFLAFGSYALFCKMLTNLAIPGWTSSVLVASFFGAVNALGICILGEYVIRIYDQVRRRPLYIVSEKRNFDLAADPAFPVELTSGWPGERRGADRRGNERRDQQRRNAERRNGQPHVDFAPSQDELVECDFDADEAALDFVAGFADAQSDLDLEYSDLMAEAEELLAMTQSFARGPKLLQEGGDGLLEDELADELNELDEDLDDASDEIRAVRSEGPRATELRPFHDNWQLDDEWPIDEVGPVDEQRPTTGWSINRPNPEGDDYKPASQPGPSGAEPRPADREQSDNPTATPGSSSARRNSREPGEW